MLKGKISPETGNLKLIRATRASGRLNTERESLTPAVARRSTKISYEQQKEGKLAVTFLGSRSEEGGDLAKATAAGADSRRQQLSAVGGRESESSVWIGSQLGWVGECYYSGFYWKI